MIILQNYLYIVYIFRYFSVFIKNFFHDLAYSLGNYLTNFPLSNYDRKLLINMTQG